MATSNPTFSTNVTVVTAAVLARGSTARGTIDLRSDYGAKLYVRMGRGGTAALTNGVDLLVRALWNNGAAGGRHPGAMPALLSSIVAASSTTVDADSNSAQATLNVASTTGFAAGDIICIQDSGGGVTRLEWARVSKITNPGASGELVLDAPLEFTHTGAQADTVRNKADTFAPIWLPPGSLYEVVFDYGDDGAGDSVTIQALAETYTEDTIT